MKNSHLYFFEREIFVFLRFMFYILFMFVYFFFAPAFFISLLPYSHMGETFRNSELKHEQLAYGAWVSRPEYGFVGYEIFFNELTAKELEDPKRIIPFYQ